MTSDALRVVHLSTEKGWRGGEQQLCGLAERMLADGHQPLIVCRPGSALDARFSPQGLARTVAMRFEFDPVAVWNIAKILREFQPQMIHAHTSHAHTLAVLAVKFSGQQNIKVVVSRRVCFPIRNGALQRWKYITSGAYFIAVSHAAKQVMVDWGVPAERISVVHSGVDMRRFETQMTTQTSDQEWTKLLPPRGTPLIVSSCALDPMKDLPTLLRSLAIIREHRPELPFRLIVAGRGVMLSELEALRGALCLNEHVHFAGFVSNIPALLARADTFTLCTKSEGIAGATLEAAAAGLPVVASNVGGIPEIFVHGESGLLVDPEQPEELADAFIRLLDNPEEAKKMAARARTIFEDDFTVASMTAGTIRAYRNLG